ncbi:MAG: hypothetical protein ABI988_11350 [Nitrospirota bacterium]
MKTSLLLLTVLAIVPLMSAPASANPATLPDHPGYPMGKAVDPVKGQSLANDPGQSNATGEKALIEAAVSDDIHVSARPQDFHRQGLSRSGHGIRSAAL